MNCIELLFAKPVDPIVQEELAAMKVLSLLCARWEIVTFCLVAQ